MSDRTNPLFSRALGLLVAALGMAACGTTSPGNQSPTHTAERQTPSADVEILPIVSQSAADRQAPATIGPYQLTYLSGEQRSKAVFELWEGTDPKHAHRKPKTSETGYLYQREQSSFVFSMHGPQLSSTGGCYYDEKSLSRQVIRARSLTNIELPIKASSTCACQHGDTRLTLNKSFYRVKAYMEDAQGRRDYTVRFVIIPTKAPAKPGLLPDSPLSLHFYDQQGNAVSSMSMEGSQPQLALLRSLSDVDKQSFACAAMMMAGAAQTSP